MDAGSAGAPAPEAEALEAERRAAAARRRAIVRFAVPTSLEVVLHQLFGLVDQVFVASLGEAGFVAAGLTTQLLSVAFIILSAVGMGASIRLARYAGGRDEAGFSKAAAQMLLLAAGLSVGIAVMAALSAPVAFELMGAAPDVAERGVFFTRLVAWSLPFMALMEMGGQVLRARGDARSPMVFGLAALATNSALNYALIFGLWVVPSMGLAGAGLATILARGLGCALTFRLLLSRRHALRVRVEDFRRLEGEQVRALARLALPAAAGQAVWTLGLLGYTRVYAALGTAELAASAIVGQLEGMCVLFSFGFGMACLTLVGQELGRHDVAEARRVAAECLRLAMWVSVATGVLMGASALFLGTLFPRLDEGTLVLAAMGLVVSALAQPVKARNMLLAVGVLRSGGDVRFAMAVETLIAPGIACAWALGVPLGWGVLGILGGRTVEELLKLAAFSWRYASGRWVHEVK